MGDGSTIIFGLFLFALCFFGAAAMVTFLATRQSDFMVVGAHAGEVRAMLDAAGVFGSGWKLTDGRGDINIRPGFFRGGRDGKPVLSIDLRDTPDGTHVTVWMSAWKTVVLKIMEPGPATFAIMRRRRIMKLLEANTEPAQPYSPQHELPRDGI